MDEEQRNQAIAHWDALIAQWQKEKEMEQRFEQRPGTISVFRNRFKKDDRHPDYKPMRNETVTCPHCDQNMDIALWQRQTKAGDAYFSVKLSVPRPTQERERKSNHKGDDSDIPW